MQPDTVASVWFAMTGCTMCVLLATVYILAWASEQELYARSPGTMASGYVQCMNYAEGLHFSAFHLSW